MVKHSLALNKPSYSRFTNDMQRFSVNFSKSTKPAVLQLCWRYSYRNCEIWVESVFFFSFGWYSSGTCPLDLMQNTLASNLMSMLLFVMVVANIYSNWPRKAKIVRSNVESQVKVTRKVIKCKQIKCHNFNSKTNGETPMRLQHPVAKIFPENLCISLVNRL